MHSWWNLKDTVEGGSEIKSAPGHNRSLFFLVTPKSSYAITPQRLDLMYFYRLHLYSSQFSSSNLCAPKHHISCLRSIDGHLQPCSTAQKTGAASSLMGVLRTTLVYLGKFCQSDNFCLSLNSKATFHGRLTSRQREITRQTPVAITPSPTI